MNHTVAFVGYMQYVYQQGGYQQYYPYQYPNRYDKGYLEEMAHYGQIPTYDPRQVFFCVLVTLPVCRKLS